MVVIVPRLVAAAAPGSASSPALPRPRGATRASCCRPRSRAGRLLNHLTERPLPRSSGDLAVADALAELPVALLIAN